MYLAARIRLACSAPISANASLRCRTSWSTPVSCSPVAAASLMPDSCVELAAVVFSGLGPGPRPIPVVISSNDATAAPMKARNNKKWRRSLILLPIGDRQMFSDVIRGGKIVDGVLIVMDNGESIRRGIFQINAATHHDDPVYVLQLTGGLVFDFHVAGRVHDAADVQGPVHVHISNCVDEGGQIIIGCKIRIGR